MQQHKHKIIISGGGTGGHIFPAIAIAHALEHALDDVNILFIGAKGKMEMELVPAAGFPIKGLWISGLHRRLTLRNFLFPFKLISSLIKARRIIKNFNPEVVVGVGGYASGAALKVATQKGIPTLIQEQNSFPGITNRLLAKKVSKICVAYEDMEKFFPASKIVMTGNPIRKEVIEINRKRREAADFFGLSEKKTTVFVVGGSQGAQSINRAVENMLSDLSGQHFQLLWQTGKAYLETAENLIGQIASQPNESHKGKASGYQMELFASDPEGRGSKSQPSRPPKRTRRWIKAVDFINRMDYAYALADVIISRAGAIAISELCAIKKPVIFIPLPSAAENHQMKNAQALANKNAAIVIEDSKVKAELKTVLISLLKDQKKRQAMMKNIGRMAVYNADKKIAGEIIQLINRS